jgi:general secretion pathway protein D
VRRPRWWASWIAVGLAAGLVGCAATVTSMRKGELAEQRQDYDRAIVEYTEAQRRHPADATIRLSLERAKLRAADAHFVRGRRASSLGKLDEALIEFQIASQLNPANTAMDDAVRETRTKLRTKIAVAREGKTQLESLVERSREVQQPGLEVPPDIKLPESLSFRDASSRDVFTALARFAEVNVIFDPAFRDTQLSLDLRRSTFDQALASVAASTHNFYRVTAPRTVTIVPDTTAKRLEYEEEVVRTFFLSNADIKETIDLLRIVVDARRIAPTAAANALTIKDTPERVAAAGRIIAAIDKARPEVAIEVEVLEVNRSKMKEYGLQIASPGTAGIDGSLDANRTGLSLQEVQTLSSAGVFLSNVPALFYRLLKSDTNTRTLANPQLRTSEGMPAQARFGDRVPVPSTTFSPIATGGVNQQPITSFSYENIGVNIDITPRIHHDDDVSLALKVEVSALSGTGYGGLPTFGNRSVNSLIRLRDGETSVLGGLIRDDERQVLEGVPGLSDIPLIGRLFAHTRKETQETDIIITLTPHIIRVLELTESDLRPFRVTRDAGSGPLGAPFLEPQKDEPAVPAKPIKPPGVPGTVIKQ